MFGFVAFSASLILLLGYFLLYPIFHYFYDPKRLRKYPNFDILSGISDLGYCYLTWRGYRSKELYEAHKHAPIIRIGPNSLSYGDIRAVKDIYGHGTLCTKDLKETILAGSHTQLFDAVDKADHAAKRKRMSAAFAIKNLEAWEYKVAELAGRLFKQLDARTTAPLPDGQSPDEEDLTVDWNKWIYLFTIEAINYIAISSTLGLLEKGSYEVTARRPDGTSYTASYRECQSQSAYLHSMFVWDYKHYRLLTWLSRFIPQWRKAWKESEPWNDVVLHQTTRRLERYQAGEKLDDFFTSLMEDKSGVPHGLEWGEIVANVGAIINAGSDTTAISLTQVLMLLIKHPQHLSSLRDEVDGVLDESDIIAPYDKVKDLPFLRSCIDEALRLIPPTSAALPRRTPPEGAQILGEWVPGNTSVTMAIYASHRDPAVFPDPEVYNPHRWMDLEARKKMEPYFIPFSAGARGCIGRNISYLEQIVVLASLVHRYDFALPHADWDIGRHEAFNLLLGEMPIKIWLRKPCNMPDTLSTAFD